MGLNLDALSSEGFVILSETTDSHRACGSLDLWVENVGEYIANTYPNTGLVAEWQALGKISPDFQYPLSFPWMSFKSLITKRLNWLSDLPRKAQLKALLNTTIVSPLGESPARTILTNNSKLFISSERIKELESLNSSKFELKKLVALCNELNMSYKGSCWYAVIALTRTILNYVPPIFGQPNFESVVAQHNVKSLKPVLDKLHNVSKNIADHHLHEPAKQNEAVLTEQQVNFGHELDVLLQEISKKLKNT
jgi:hypothetical protein